MIRLASHVNKLTFPAKRLQANFHYDGWYIKTAQLNANQISEDRLSYYKLTSIPAFFVSVFDGHGGGLCAQYAFTHLQWRLEERMKINLELNMPIEEMVQLSLTQAYQSVEDGFFQVFKKNLQAREYHRVGSCALSAVILKDSIHIANLGDCEGFILSPDKIEPTNKRLNASEPSEKARLTNKFPNQSDIIVSNGVTNYVKGRLQPTYAFGDYYLKHKQYNFSNLQTFTGPYIESRPIISRFPITDTTRDLIIATEGIWDQLSIQKLKELYLKNPYDISKSVYDEVITKILKRGNLKSIDQLIRVPNRRNLHDDITLASINLQHFRQQYMKRTG